MTRWISPAANADPWSASIAFSSSSIVSAAALCNDSTARFSAVTGSGALVAETEP